MSGAIIFNVPAPSLAVDLALDAALSDFTELVWQLDTFAECVIKFDGGLSDDQRKVRDHVISMATRRFNVKMRVALAGRAW